MRILHAAAEYAPLVSTGGLGEVLGALPQAQRLLGDDVRVVLPAYGFLDATLRSGETVAAFEVFGRACRIRRSPWAQAGLPLYFCEIGELFDRDGDPYRDAQGREHADNPQRFAAFCAAVARFAAAPAFAPQLVHAHDWHCGLVPALLKAAGVRAAAVYSLHNLAYQGLCTPSQQAAIVAATGVGEAGRDPQGQWSLMAAGLRHADAVLTVSPSYAQEVCQEQGGFGLQALLRQRRAQGSLHGIVNGIDAVQWDPCSDPRLVRRYGVDDAEAGKRCNRDALRRELGLPGGPQPMLAFVGRLTEQKGADLLLDLLRRESAPGFDVVIVGMGDAELAAALRAQARQSPALAFCEVYDGDLVHRLLAAADLLVMPSRWEPCGMVQLYAQRYGTMPVVHATGGLRDTVVDADAATLADATASGVRFDALSVDALQNALQRALQLHAAPASRQRLRQLMMSKKTAWSEAARQYASIYRDLLARNES